MLYKIIDRRFMTIEDLMSISVLLTAVRFSARFEIAGLCAVIIFVGVGCILGGQVLLYDSSALKQHG